MLSRDPAQSCNATLQGSLTRNAGGRTGQLIETSATVPTSLDSRTGTPLIFAAILKKKQVSSVFSFFLQYFLLPGYYQFLLVTAVTIITVIEILRLYLGYIGNLHEKVPELAGFLLLTFLIQMPLFLFLLTDEKILILPLEVAVHAIYVFLLNMELLVSFFVLKIMTRQLATQFYLHQTDELENKNVPAKCSQVTLQRCKRSTIELQERDALLY
ncbi:hypothetical protein AB205_0204430 [Aquarana catesbeiana]|uniref:Transmembrane protein 17 n=1 Tax=Aquarana catesbeiana TaxID=8400 RepID=A0A2G9REA2_AQUCT|nr:hypothetical protein AB205_0204430 [Aquarana catesbeiana]